jgi:hypothetical protein
LLGLCHRISARASYNPVKVCMAYALHFCKWPLAEQGG